VVGNGAVPCWELCICCGGFALLKFYLKIGISSHDLSLYWKSLCWKCLCWKFPLSSTNLRFFQVCVGFWTWWLSAIHHLPTLYMRCFSICRNEKDCRISSISIFWGTWYFEIKRNVCLTHLYNNSHNYLTLHFISFL
jgi:hypothetical protein